MPDHARALLSALLLAVPCTGAGEEERAFLDLRVERSEVFPGEAVPLTLVIGFEQRLLDEELVPLFPRPLDLPVQVHAPWMDLVGVQWLEPREYAEGRSFALGSEEAELDPLSSEVRGGRTFECFAIELRFVPEFPGPIALEGTELRFARAGRPAGDSLLGPAPRDRIEQRVLSEALRLEVIALPEPGRPDTFRGAVGRFDVALDVHPRSLRVGETLELSLSLTGEGDLMRFDPPRLDLGAHERLLGMRDDGYRGTRTVIYDVAILSTRVERAPRVEFSWYDPTPPGGYRTWVSESLDLLIQAPPASESTSELEVLGGAAAPAGDDEAPGLPVWPWAAGVAGVLVLSGLMARRRRGASPPVSGGHRQSIDRGEAPVDVWVDYLATHLSCSHAAVVDPDLCSRLETAGLPAEEAGQAAELCEELIGARYGGQGPEDPEQAVREAIQRCDPLWGNVRPG